MIRVFFIVSKFPIVNLPLKDLTVESLEQHKQI